MGYYVGVEPNVKVYVEDVNPEGDKTILFIHGWPANHQMFEYQFNQLPKLGYRCIGVDTRGFGKSDQPFDGYNYDRLADDIRYVVEALELKNFILCGHSMGGASSIRYMARYNGYGVSKLVLLGAAAPSVTIQPDFPYGLPKEEVTKLIEQTYQDRPNMLQNFGEIFFFQNTTPAFQNWFLQLGLPAAGWATAACAATFRDETLFSDLPKISVPTLILHGVHDKVCLFPLALYMQQHIKNSTLIPFENSGHGLFWEEQDKVNEEIAKFIKE